tara:strand:+ start:610 stop:1587 length:978 start_codon:yes stop_codon:yes gene_type:complete
MGASLFSPSVIADRLGAIGTLLPRERAQTTMYYRQKVLLALLESFGGKLASTDFQKYLFLYSRLCEKDRSYEFVPYKYGCFSFQSYADKSKLVASGYLEDAKDWKLSDSFNNHTAQLKKDDAGKIQLFHDKYVSLKGKKLLQHVYRGYPYYAINSLVANEILTADEYAAVQKLKAPKKGKLFATIGYEGITVEEYLNKLIENNIRLLVDVRKNPLSRKYGFSKTKLSELLNNVGISYKHLPKLGIVSDKRKSLKTSQDYKNLFSNYETTVIPEEKDSIAQLYDFYLDSSRIAITCFEECHTMCHRHKVADAVAGIAHSKFKVVHL